MSKLTAEARAVLERICAAYAAQPFPADKAAELRPPALCRAEQRLALAELMAEGLLELRRRIWGEELYQIPEARFAGVQHAFAFASVKPAAQPEEEIVPEELATGPGLAGELFRALVYTAQEGLPLTAKGVIRQKNLAGLAGALTLRGLPGPELLPFSAEPEAAALLMVDLLLALGLLVRQEDAYVLEPGALSGWLELDETQMAGVLYRLILGRYGASDPGAQHFRYLIAAEAYPVGDWFPVAEPLRRLRDRGFAPNAEPGAVAAAAEAWLRLLAGFGWCRLGRSPEGGLCFRWREPKPAVSEANAHEAAVRPPSLGAAEANPAEGINEVTGCVRVVAAENVRATEAVLTTQTARTHDSADAGLTAQSAQTAQMQYSADAEQTAPSAHTPQPARTIPPTLLVQPDLEVLVPPGTGFAVRWKLAQLAEPLHTEELWSFRLSRARLEQSAGKGLDPEALIRWLAEHAEGGLPAQASQALALWARAAGRTELAETLLLTCRGEADGDDIAAHPRLQGHVSRIAPCYFIVRRESAALVRKELAAAGLAAAAADPGRAAASAGPDILWPADAEAQFPPEPSRPGYRVPGDTAERGLAARAVPQLQLPPAVPEPAELFPGKERVPQMWLKEMREYHASTAQQVMEQAAEWGVKVTVTRGGRTFDFIPEIVSRHPWKVCGSCIDPEGGTEPAELHSGEWQQMRLRIPDRA
ncbi:helicase-associated domain-containing protein [Paenibacillus sp. NFR01]|uniref:helicase-associated domain-containing protein n=1 Tax=Paenibacillus sp. NFR01 TaxID=1566279 RepID=UPI0008BD1D88|nr:helicase-associated domain-containing protein [Paenibacillus sp. NFR01]SET47307.1 Helicase conserved C-terminal domain-containing protein [Paenibacillus sp. NFR01]